MYLYDEEALHHNEEVQSFEAAGRFELILVELACLVTFVLGLERAHVLIDVGVSLIYAIRLVEVARLDLTCLVWAGLEVARLSSGLTVLPTRI